MVSFVIFFEFLNVLYVNSLTIDNFAIRIIYIFMFFLFIFGQFYTNSTNELETLMDVQFLQFYATSAVLARYNRISDIWIQGVIVVYNQYSTVKCIITHRFLDILV